MQEQSNAILFEGASLGTIELNNRIIMAPMTRSRAIGNLPNDLVSTYYEQRASAGLIITEGVAPSPNGLGYARIPGVFNAAQTAAWGKVAEHIHKAGGKAFMQLMHTGRVSHPANMPEGAIVLGPSAVGSAESIWTDSEGMQPLPVPKAMGPEDIKDTIEEFAKAAKNAIDAGFDGIELHGANGYLLEQFLNPQVNQRNDAYGGSVEARAAFVLETVKAVADIIGTDKVGIRLSPYNRYNDMPAYESTYATYDYLSRQLQQLGIAYIHLIDYAARSSDEGLQLIDTIRANFTGTLILNGGYTTERAAEALKNGQADLISFGAPFIANPNLPHKLKTGAPLAAADTNLFFTAGAEGYTDYQPN